MSPQIVSSSDNRFAFPQRLTMVFFALPFLGIGAFIGANALGYSHNFHVGEAKTLLSCFGGTFFTAGCIFLAGATQAPARVAAFLVALTMTFFTMTWWAFATLPNSVPVEETYSSSFIPTRTHHGAMSQDGRTVCKVAATVMSLMTVFAWVGVLSGKLKGNGEFKLRSSSRISLQSDRRKLSGLKGKLLMKLMEAAAAEADRRGDQQGVEAVRRAEKELIQQGDQPEMMDLNKIQALSDEVQKRKDY